METAPVEKEKKSYEDSELSLYAHIWECAQKSSYTMRQTHV